MKFKKQQERWSTAHYVGRKNRFRFDYSYGNVGWYVVINHMEKDIRFNTLWSNIQFMSEVEVQAWCNIFDYTKFECKGDDVKS